MDTWEPGSAILRKEGTMTTVREIRTGKEYRCRKLGHDRYHIIGTCRIYTEAEFRQRFRTID